MSSQPRLAHELTSVFARTSGLMLAERTVDSVLRLVTETAVQTVLPAVGAGITVVGPDGGRRTSHATDPMVEQADDLQYSLAEGPCITAAEQRHLVRVDDADQDDRWPTWAAAAAAAGLRSVLSAPLVAGDACLGALKVYARQPHAFTDRDEGTMSLLAGQSALLLAHAQEHHRAGELSSDLKEVLERRDVLTRACGVVMGRDQVSADVAFARLVALAAEQRRSVHDTAGRLLADLERLG